MQVQWGGQGEPGIDVGGGEELQKPAVDRVRVCGTRNVAVSGGSYVGVVVR